MTSGAGAMVATAMRVVNAVPYVVDAQPGLLSSVDLPLTIPRDAFSPRRELTLGKSQVGLLELFDVHVLEGDDSNVLDETCGPVHVPHPGVASLSSK